ncbi:unnamed protein product [Malus baccata var. baccata]
MYWILAISLSSVIGHKFLRAAHQIGGPEPTGHKEVFNHMYSSLRSIVERNFGVWKKRWAILRDMPNYMFNKQAKIVLATMTLHNYIRRYFECDRHFDDPRDYCEKSDIKLKNHMR